MKYDNYITWKSWNKNDFGNLNSHDKQYFDSIFDSIKIQSKNNVKVLEVGYGNGSFLRYCRDKKYDIFGVEINVDLIEAAKEKKFNVFTPDEILHIHEDSFDLIVLFDVLEHLDVSFIEESILVYRKILKDGGVLVARYPNSDSPFSLPIQHGDITHVTAIGSGMIRYWMKIANFKITYIGPDERYFNINIGILRYILKSIKFLIIFVFNKLLNIFYSNNVNYLSPNSILFAKLNK